MGLKKILVIISLAAFVVTVTACSPGRWFAAKPYKETRFLMDTIIDITAYGPDAEPAVKAAFAEFKRLHDLSNNFDPNSNVSQINRMAGKEKVKTDPDLLAMIKRSNELADQLDGVFDVTIGPLTELWGIGRKGNFVPSQTEINNVLPLVNYRLVEIDSGNQTVYLPKAGMSLDLGGIAKGYATDRAIEILKAYGVTSALINAGGDVRIIGRKPDGAPWRLGVQHPRKPDGIIAKMPMTDWDTLETSGDYQRYIENNGERYSHILDPRTGRQPRRLISVTMAINNSADGDIFSTALFTLGPERALAVLKNFPGVEAVMITAEGQVITSPGLEGRIEIVGE